ncbi:MAG: class I SAM-dependent methyltransferase [Patescibacteria group bacterium]
MPTVDEVKNFWDSRPCNIKHSAKTIGTKEFFDEVEKRKYFVEPHIMDFAEFPRWNGKKVLEIGCGIGTDAVNFARYGADYYGLELSSESLEIAKKRFDVYGLRGNFFLGNAENIDEIIPNQIFDLIYSFGVIHHTPSPEQVIEKAKTFMSENSEFRLMLYAKNSWKSFMIEAGFDQPEAQYGCPIAYTYSYEDIKQLLQDFKITELKQDHIFPYIVEDYKKYIYNRQPWFEVMPTEMFKVLEKNLGWHTLIKCKLA